MTSVTPRQLPCNSYYRATVADADVCRAPLSDPLDIDVAIVGAGFAGLNTALELAEKGISVAVFEAGEIGHGASGRNGGFVFGGYSLGEFELLKQSGPTDARALYAMTLDAVDTIRQRAASMPLDCEVQDSGVIWANWFRDASVLNSRRQVLSSTYGVSWQHLSAQQLRSFVRSDRYSEGMYERDAFHFHPLRYAAGLAARIEDLGGRIVTHSPVLGIERDRAGWQLRIAGEIQVRCQALVLCGGGYLNGVAPAAERVTMPVSTYVMVTEPLGARLDAVLPSDSAVYDSRFAFDYYRKLRDGRLLWGGRISVRDPDRATVQSRLMRDMQRVFPTLADARIDYCWSGLMSYARHQMPQLAQIEPNLWVGQSFGGHGVATTTVGGTVLGDAIAAQLNGQPAPDSLRLFSPYGLTRTFGVGGLAAAQLNYWMAQTRDAIRVALG